MRPSPPGADASGPIEVAPHDVFFDDVRQLWYCDIEIDHGRSYWPFVRLALARYQPASDSGAHLSDVVRWRAVARGEPTPPDPPRRPWLEPELVVTARQKIAARDFESLLKDGLAERLSVAPTLWDGRIDLSRVETGVKLRIVVAEYEEYAIDDVAPRTGMGRRLVFVEHVQLD